MPAFSKRVNVFGSPDIEVDVDGGCNVIDLELATGGTTSMYAAESKRLRKALKKAEKVAKENACA